MTIVAEGGPERRDRMVRQLGKLVDVLEAGALAQAPMVARELARGKVRCGPENRAAIVQIADGCRARVADVAPATLTPEATGDEDGVNALLGLLQDFGIREVARTGRVAPGRGGPLTVRGRSDGSE